jgi:hypothetical protein
MKRLLCLAAIASTLLTRATAQSKDAVSVTNHFPEVAGITNELSSKDLQDILGIWSWKFNVRLASPTNGVRVSIELRREGEKPQTLSQEILDRGKLDNNGKSAGTNLALTLAISPQGAMDGVGLFEAKQLRIFWRMPYGNVDGVITNPFFKFKGGVVGYPAGSPNPEGKIMLLEGNNFESPKQRIELFLRFEQF